MIELVHYLVALFSVQSTPNLHLSFESLGALLRLHDPRVIPRWNPEAGIATFWEVRWAPCKYNSTPCLGATQAPSNMLGLRFATFL